MPNHNILIKALRWILLPFSWLYGLVMLIRNTLYDHGWLASYSPDCKTICVGNLSVGGTGKSPLTLWLIELLKHKHKVAVLSRGYGRKTHGFRWVEQSSSAHECGDEPLMIKHKHHDVSVAVCENRVEGAKRILEAAPDTDVMILDDAMQHRKIKCGMTLLVTPWYNLYPNDLMLPTGNLREPAAGARRADIIIVSKCPELIMDGGERAEAEKQRVRSLLGRGHDEVFMATIQYGNPLDCNGKETTLPDKLVVATGIANPQPLIEHLNNANKELLTVIFPDHYRFSEKDLLLLQIKCEQLGKDSVILTTEKDLERMREVKAFAAVKERIIVMPIKPYFTQLETLTSKIQEYVRKN